MNDYEIEIGDVINGVYTGEFVNLSDDGFCGVRFDGIGSPDLRESTYDVSGGDGSQFGIELYGSVNWTITGSIHGGDNKNTPGDPATAWGAWSRLYRAWIDYPGRKITREVIPLYFKRPGREQMVVYGRPRRIDPDSSTSYTGFIAYTALFKQSDPRFYSATDTSVTVQLLASSYGGLLLTEAQDALAVPLSTSDTVIRPGLLTNQGDTNTNPVITFSGPVTNPALYLFGDDGLLWTISLIASIPDGLDVVVDTRLWKRSIATPEGASFAGVYRGDKLQDIVLPPGSFEFEYTGTDGTGTSTCTINYRDAWASS